MMTKIETEAMEAVIGIHKELVKANEIDWEQRRYEIAKELYIRTCQQTKLEGDNTAADVFRSVAWLSRVAADYLIEILKK